MEPDNNVPEYIDYWKTLNTLSDSIGRIKRDAQDVVMSVISGELDTADKFNCGLVCAYGHCLDIIYGSTAWRDNVNGLPAIFEL